MANTKVQSEQIEDGSITADKLADGTIVAAELANNAVVTAAINADAVTGAKIADDAIDSEHYTDGSIDTAHIADAQITVAKMAANSVDSDQYVDGSIDTAHLGDLQVTTAKIANGNISTAKIADNAVTSAKIDTNIDIAGTFDVTGATTLDAGATIVGSGTGAGLYLNGTNSDSIAQGNFVRYGTNFLTQSDAANDDLITYAFNGSTFVNALNIKSNGNVGIKQSTPSSPNGATDFLHIGNSSSTFSSLILEDNNNTWEIFQNNQLSIRDGTDTRLLIDTSGNVGIGETTPLGKLHIKSADSAASSVNANANELVVENSDYTGISILGENECNIHFGDNEDPDVGRIEYHHSSNSMIFRTNASDAMTITSDGTLKTTAGSNVTTVSGSTSFLIHESADVKNVADSSTGSATYRDMHRFYCNKSGQFKVKWQALIHSGSHYWAGRFLLNGSQMKKSDNSTDATHYFGSSLASGESAAVHAYRTFEMDLGDVKAGDVIQYQMVSSSGGGTPVDGAGQHLRMRNFQVYSSTPSNMSSPVIGESLGQADTDSQNMTGLTIGSVGIDNKAGMALKTQFALHDEWNDICYVNNAGTTGVTFLMNATRDLDQNRHKTALVRYAYNQAFTEISNSQQNTTIEYQVTDNRLQYRFTSAGNYLVTLLVMTGG